MFQVEMNNGIVKITVSRPYGNLRGIKYHGVENLLDDGLDRDDRGYTTFPINTLEGNILWQT